jgi:tetratricopeptide (TPR) repeat protein
MLDLTTGLLRERTAELSDVREAYGKIRGGGVQLISEPDEPSKVSVIDISKVLEAHRGPNSQILANLLDHAAALLNDGEEREALRMYERAMLLSSSNKALYRGVALIFFERERFSDSLRIYSRLESMSPAFSGVDLMCAALLAQTGDCGAALTRLAAIDGTSSINGPARFFLGLTNVAVDDLKEADAHLTTARDSFGDSAELLLMIASVRFDLGLLDSALLAAERAIALDSDYTDALFLAAMIYNRKGSADRAQAFVAEAASRDAGGSACARFLVVGSAFPANSVIFAQLRETKSGILSALPRRLRRFAEQVLLDALQPSV